MFRWMPALVAGLTVAVSSMAENAAGQTPAGRSSSPYRGPGLGLYGAPLMSPWFDLYRRDVGPLPNYYQIVRPRLEVERALRQQSAELRRQGAELRHLEGRTTGAVRSSGLGPTGTRSRFMDHSHYYPGLR